MRTRELVREAWRNVSVGVGRPLVWGFTFIGLIGMLCAVQVNASVSLNKQAAEWLAAGAAIQIVELEGRIDGGQCDALANTPGVSGSGAIRGAEGVILSVLPSTKVSSFEVTQGFPSMLGARDSSVTGVAVSQDLAEVLGDNLGDVVRDLSGDPETTTNVYPFKDDGRDPQLAFGMLQTVPSVGAFDACWVEVWPQDSVSEQVLPMPLLVDQTLGDEVQPKIRQYNPSKGQRFDASGSSFLPVWVYFVAGSSFGVLIGGALVRARKLELASALHAGVGAPALTTQLMLETVMWLVPASATLVTLSLWLSILDNPEPYLSALLPALTSILLAGASTLVTCAVFTASIRESQLFKYFKNR